MHKIISHTIHRRTVSFCTAVLLFLILAACGGRATPTASPLAEGPAAADASTTTMPDTSQSVSLVNQDLLQADGVEMGCDSSDGVDFTCEQVMAQPRLAVTLDGGGFARWVLRVAETEPLLTGDETLLLNVYHQGQLTPNLYLVEETGRRVAVALTQFGLQPSEQGGTQTIAIPLREIRDDAKQWPDFSAVREVQLVFEWAAMAGELRLLELTFADRWEQAVPVTAKSNELAADLILPTGFVATAIADQISAATQLAFTTADSPWGETLWVSTQPGRIWRYTDSNSDGIYDTRLLYATGFTEIVGLLPDPLDGAVWVGGRGALFRTLDRDGNRVTDLRETRLEGLPWGRHQNNGLAWNPDPDPFTGEAGNHWLYFGLGSTEDLEVGGEWNAQVLRFPRDGQGVADLETVSRGNRNPYMLVWAPVPVDLAVSNGDFTWQLFASENGPDFNDAPDEVNHIRWQHDYGFPDQFGPVDSAGESTSASRHENAENSASASRHENAENSASASRHDKIYSGPIYPVVAHASASGLAYATNNNWPAAYRTLYVSLFGQVFGTEVVGHTVDRITLEPVETATGLTYRGVPSVFIAGLDRPLPMTTTPAGNLVVADYATGVVYRVDYVAGE